MLRIALAGCMLATVGACSSSGPTVVSKVPSAVISELAPTGKLRAAINVGNPILAAKDAGTGEPRGVSVDIARELAARLGVPIELITYQSAGKVVAAVKSGAWDIAFVAIDPARSVDLISSPPYLVIEGSYLVPAGSKIARNDEVDQEGVRVAVGSGSALDLFLSRELKHATIVRAPTSPAAADMMIANKLEVAAGVRQQLEADAKRIPGLRLLDGRFMAINQAMATPKGRDAGARFIHDFIEELKASGFIAQALQRHGIEGATVAGPAPAR